ncbi:LysR family transcriptional regulator [Vibrio crassostreae]|uniref:LysR family transcriptional regulator n=1 Tax=Vibrio crassostreae TaxID=246167 RepID=UPI0006338D71|nr:LysR family transcriptional regulator [Vibrio crassostreae]ROO76230.1 LysR family transcriptional regulator [Vibrio crassostreae]ROP14240.1 LysR family transcriptional regulator [Vibrio crassostreae]ROQ88325.1 LysR family transcriptional regulator [Vibrio crassostreae]ROR87325.1 LysR family transcriptional regulator [Vibrio crassostreae]ROS71144.1 LysR family transcriptional regulator [Vibrio crassostreae]
MNTSDLNLFIRIVETGSITETANQLSLTPPAVSSALKRLEKQLDVQLLIRTTRQLRITPQGEQFLFHCRQALASLEQGRIAAHQTLGKVSGNLRLSVSSDLGRNTIIHWIEELLDEHPLLSIDLTVGDSISDFFLDQVDMVLRYGKPEDSSMVSFHIATMNRITCASPEYISKHGKPSHPSDLKAHNCLLHRRVGRLFNSWEYADHTGSYKVKVDSNRVSNDTDIVRRWAVSGKGIAYRSQIDIHSDLESGQLIQILSEFESPSVELNLICPSREQVSPAVIAFRELLRKKVAQIAF